MDFLRNCLLYTSAATLIGTGSAWAQSPSQVAQPTTQSPSKLHVIPPATQRPSLVTQPQFYALPETVHVPSKQQAPTVIHQGDWGVFNADGGTAAGFGPVSRYATARWAEDWRVLRDPSKSDDFFDPLKFIPLNDSKSIYLTLSLDERLRNWFETRPFLGTQKPNDSGRMTLRGLYGADLHLGEHLRIYGELVNGDAGGWNYYGYNATYRKDLDLQQAFVEGRAILLGARSGVILGRQSFLDAPNYVLFARETPNVPLSWDGGRVYAVWPRVRIDAFDFVQTNTSPTAEFHDTQNWNARLFGGYESWAPPNFTFLKQPGHVFLDFFYLGYLLGGSPAAIATATTNGTQSGSTIRHNIGTRFWGKAGPIQFSLGGIFQGGEFRPANGGQTRQVRAFSINTFAGYRFSSVYGAPLLGLQADVYSGGNYHNTTGTVGTYLAPYSPQTNYLDTTTYIAPSNLIDVAPTLEMSPTRSTLLRFRVPVFWRENTNDAVYGSSRIYGFRNAYSGGWIGVSPQMNFGIRLTRHLTWTHDLARMFLSRELQKAGASEGTYYLSTLDFRF